MTPGRSVSIGFGMKKRPLEASTALVATRNVTLRSSNSRRGREPSLPRQPTLLQPGIGMVLPCGKPSPQNDWGICSSSGARSTCPEKRRQSLIGVESTGFMAETLMMQRQKKRFVAPSSSTRRPTSFTFSSEIST